MKSRVDRANLLVRDRHRLLRGQRRDSGLHGLNRFEILKRSPLPSVGYEIEEPHFIVPVVC